MAPSYTPQTFAPTNANFVPQMVATAACDDLRRDPTITNPALIAECGASRTAYNDRVNSWKSETGGPIDKCDPVILSAAWCGQTEQQRADAIAAQVAADHVIALRAKRDAGKKLTAKESAIVAKADVDEASARLAAQAAQAQAIIQQAQNALLRQQQEIAYQQQPAACTAAADLVALSIRSFWGGIAAGLATGTACMN